MIGGVKPRFFPSPDAWHAWLEENHDEHKELLVGFYKVGSGKPSITWPEAVDGALCFGWIDGVRRSLDEISYVIRFTPRRARSVWSATNIKRVAELTKLGLMRPAGVRAFERAHRRPGGDLCLRATHGRRALGAAYEKRFRANQKAWKFFQAQPPWYQRTASWWVISAKETQRKRLAQLIEDSEHARTIRQLRRLADKK